MKKDRDIYVVGAARTAIGTFGGSLKDVPLPNRDASVERSKYSRISAIEWPQHSA